MTTNPPHPPGPVLGPWWSRLARTADKLNGYAAGRLDQWEHDRAEIERLRALLARYREETPLGHQPHMIAHEVDKALGR